jgi:hypothetical protein
MKNTGTHPEKSRPFVKYDVLVSFSDPQDGGMVYWAGLDTYPREGYTPTEERIAYLQSDKTCFKKPVISGKAKQ